MRDVFKASAIFGGRAYRFGKPLGADSKGVLLACGINIGKISAVGQVEGAHEFLKQRCRAAVGVLKMVDNPYNCLTLCSGSLNANPENNVADIVRKHCDRIAFAHIRNVKHFPNGDFRESSHRDCDGDTGILEILRAYHECGFNGYIRPDHGRHLWGEKAGTVRPGYGLYDRALGIMYMLGVWDLLERQKESK